MLDLATLIIAGKLPPIGRWPDSSRPAMLLPKMLLVVQPELDMVCQLGWFLTGSAVQAPRSALKCLQPAMQLVVNRQPRSWPLMWRLASRPCWEA